MTALLRQWKDGNAQAFNQLVDLIYPELKRLARKCLLGEHPDNPVHTGTLVHEAYLRLMSSCNRLHWNDRTHFLSVAATVMRRVLVDEARRRKSDKRGGSAGTILLDEAVISSRQRDNDLIALDEALEQMKLHFERKYRVVELRCFAGLSIEETAEVLGISADIVKREWRTAKMWLKRELEAKAINNGSGQTEAD